MQQTLPQTFPQKRRHYCPPHNAAALDAAYKSAICAEAR